MTLTATKLQVSALQDTTAPALYSIMDDRSARSFSNRLILLYCSIFYFFPFFIFITIGNPLERVMVKEPSYILGILYVVVFFMLFKVATRLPVVKVKFNTIGLSRLFFDSRLCLLLAIGFSFFAYITQSILGLSFRQSGVPLAETGSIGFLLELQKMYFGIVILVNFRLIREGFQTKNRGISLIFIALGFFFSIQAAFDIFFVAFALAASAVNWKRLLGFENKLYRYISISFLPVLVYLALFVGTANKVGVDSALAILSNFTVIIEELVQRLGYHFYSTSIHVTDNFINIGQGMDALNELFHVIRYRFSVLLGISGVEKPEVGTISRMNYINMAPTYSDRIGASPSMIGSIFYLPGAGFAVFYYVFIIRGLTSLFWRVIGQQGMGWFPMIFCLILMGTILDASLDSLNPLSTGFVRLFFLFLGARFVTQLLEQRETQAYFQNQGSNDEQPHPSS